MTQVKFYYCQLNHVPGGAYEEIPTQLIPWAGHTVMYPFFNNPEWLTILTNTAGAYLDNPYFIEMQSKRDEYEAYYTTKMAVISAQYDMLKTELNSDEMLTAFAFLYPAKWDIEIKCVEIGETLFELMAEIAPGLPADYKAFVTAMDAN
jgi:hypothetical protein